MKPFRARFDSECAECGWEIDEGDMIVMTDDGAVHEDCAPKGMFSFAL